MSGNPKDLAEYNRRTNIQSRLKKLFKNENSYYVWIVTEQALLSPPISHFFTAPYYLDFLCNFLYFFVITALLMPSNCSEMLGD